jgi:hypothetical protein
VKHAAKVVQIAADMQRKGDAYAHEVFDYDGVR